MIIFYVLDGTCHIILLHNIDGFFLYTIIYLNIYIYIDVCIHYLTSKKFYVLLKSAVHTHAPLTRRQSFPRTTNYLLCMCVCVKCTIRWGLRNHARSIINYIVAYTSCPTPLLLAPVLLLLWVLSSNYSGRVTVRGTYIYIVCCSLYDGAYQAVHKPRTMGFSVFSI